MLRTDFGTFKYLGLLAVLSVTFGLVTNFTKARLTMLFGVPVPMSVYVFPAVYLIADILTEVYGYAQSRSVLWLCIASRLIASITVSLLLLIPAAPEFKDEAAYQIVLSSGLRMALTAMVATFTGDICSSYVLAKMKIWSAGKHLWLRFVVSTFAGESVNSVFAITLAFYGVLSTHGLISAIIVTALAKTAWEIIALPVTYPIVNYLKKVEGVDHYDRHTNFNPFITDATSGPATR